MINETILNLIHTDCSHPVFARDSKHLDQSVNWDPKRRVAEPLSRVFSKVLEFDIGINYANVGVTRTNDMILEIVRNNRPKYVFWPTMSYEILEDTFAAIRQEGSYVVGWFFDDECRFDEYSRWWISFMDYMFTTDKVAVARYQELGAKAIHLLVTADPEFFKPAYSEVSWDVSFVGSRSVADRDNLVDLLINAGVKVSAFGKGWPNGYVSNEEMLQIYSNSKINICFTKSYGIGTRNQIKNKIFDITMCGGFLLCEYVDGIEEFFDINKEIVCFHDCEDALLKITYYIGNDNEREQIALRGKERSANNYSQQKLFEKAFNVLELDTQFEPKRFSVNNLLLNMPVQPNSLAAQFHLRWAEVMRTEGFDEWRWREEYELACRYDRSLEGRFDQINDIPIALTDKSLLTKAANKHLIVLINGYRVGTPVLPTGIGYIAQAIEDAGFDYEVCDVNIHSEDQIVERVKILKPAYVGLGTMTFEVENNYQLLQAIRESMPDVIIILGGPHAIAAGNEIFEECSAIDLVIQGEGEDSLVKLLNGEPLHTIPGILARHAIKESPFYEPLNITRIAFPRYHKFALEKYGNIINIASSRGCVYKCSFCGAPKFLGKKWRAFSVSRMIEEFEYWYGRYYRNFYFSDSLFALDKQRVIDFCAYIVESGYKDVVFTVDGARADHLTLEVLHHMKKANFKFLTIGVESVNDKTLEFFQKGETFNQIDNAISIADSLGFDITVYLIIGAPEESYDDALKSIYYPLKFKNIVKSIVSKLMPIKGTPYYQYAIDHGLVANPKLCYPLHEVSGFNKRIGSNNPVEEIWEALYPEIDKISKVLDVRNRIKKYLEEQGLPDIEVNILNTLAEDSITGAKVATNNNVEQVNTKIQSDLTAIYNSEFYSEQQDASLQSAKILVPIILGAVRVQSVIDVGCGVGAWLHVFKSHGIDTIYGYDANELEAGNYYVDKSYITTNVDFSSDKFTLNESADLLICLEVAEHLPDCAAEKFVLNLANAAPIIIFSAALPGQTGVNHINEQPPWYWREKFNKIGYYEIDFLRPQILANEDICWWYRQNITCFAAPSVLETHPEVAELAKYYGQNNSPYKMTLVSEWLLKRIFSGEYLFGTPLNQQASELTNVPSTQERSRLSHMFLSVVIPTRNRAKLLYNTLESLVSQTYPKDSFEVIVIDNGSEDETAEVCEHFRLRLPNVRCCLAPHPGLHIARHVGLKEANGEVLVYADDDIEAQPTWLEGIAESFADPEVALVGGKILPKFEVPPPEWVAELSTKTGSGWALGWYSILDFGDTPHEIQHEYIWGCNFSIRKDVLKKAGGFHPDAFPQEMIKYRGDGETAVSIAVRGMGLKAMYNPKAAVFHVVGAERMTLDYLYRRAFNQGISDSFSSIRKIQSLVDPLPYSASSNPILDTVNRGLVDGFNYHQQMVKSDKKLWEWVLKDDYFEEDDSLQEISSPVYNNITVTTDADTNNILPKTIQISISDACNFKCTSCWIHGPNVAADDNNLEASLFRDSKPQVMDVRVYERLIADLKKNPEPVSIFFCGKGEPTLHPRFLYMAEFAYKNGLSSNITTNGSGLTIEMLKVLRKMGVTLNFSLNAYSQESHQTFCNTQKDFFTSIIEMLRFFSGPEYSGFISLSFVIGSHNIGKIKNMAELSAEILPFGGAINFYPEWTHSGNPENRVSSGQIVTLLDELSDIIDILCNSNISHNLNVLPYVLYGICVSKEADEPTRDYYLQNPCNTVDNFMVVLADGRAVPCCRSAYVYGNINERSIFEIWSDPKSIEFRHKAKSIATLKKEAPSSHCFSCDHIMGNEYFINRYRSDINALMLARQ